MGYFGQYTSSLSPPVSKEEATILAGMKKRSKRWRRTTRNIIAFSVLLESVAIGYAIMTTRSVNLEWNIRAMRVLLMFVLPVLSWALDERSLERLREERQAKINELKDRTNYYNTQQFIQRYDSDPAAKAAAATVLASKLGAESGLQVSIDDSHLTGKSNDFEVLQSVKQPLSPKPISSVASSPVIDFSSGKRSKIRLPFAGKHSSKIGMESLGNSYIFKVSCLQAVSF
ncbi:hypothetical protein LXL04_018060 [Taraxacum kok-saghyz]